MRSSKSRSRGNKNRNNRPSAGNIINRVFDSSGPDGKVRGTPQQIIDKYNQLHRDAQLTGDRVAAENFAQHAEHYTRMLAEAQREVDRAREEQEEENRRRQADRDRERAERMKAQEETSSAGMSHGSDQPDYEPHRPQPAAEVAAPTEVEASAPSSTPAQAPAPRAERPARAPRRPAPKVEEAKPQPAEVIDNGSDDDAQDSGLVETPESTPKAARKPRARKPRKPEDAAAGPTDAAAE